MNEQELAQIEERFLGIHDFIAVELLPGGEPVCKRCPAPEQNHPTEGFAAMYSPQQEAIVALVAEVRRLQKGI